ncbi:hypothetical protein ES703_86371 [subsurface metagenome]
MKRNRKTEREHPVIKQILEEINIIDKINRQWKDGVITEFQFSTTLDRILANIKRHQTELKKPGPQSLSEKIWRKGDD